MYLHATEYKYKHIYDIKNLKSYCDHAENDIRRAEEAIKKIREYQAELFAHVQEVLNTEFKKVVVLNRSVDYKNKVAYHVHMEERPQVEQEHVENNRIYGTFHDQKKFAGTERHNAIKYANELAKTYRCELEKKGRWN